MRIGNRFGTVMTWRALTNADEGLRQSIARLSSGLRINGASDDAAGLAISQRLLGQIRGLAQARRGTADAVSLVQTAEGALAEVHSLLNRANVLAIQASNGTLSAGDRHSAQLEVAQILAEIDRIADTTTYNDRRLLNPSGNAAAVAAAVNGLRSGWLAQSESLINTYYGLFGGGAPLTIVLESSGQQPTWVSGTPGVNGKLDNLKLHINLAAFGTGGGPDGGPGPVYNDRAVASALTQAILARSSNYVNLQSWFKSGVSDFMAGGLELLNGAISTYGNAAVVNAITPWADDTLHYASAYLATRYLDAQLTAAGSSMSTLMSFLNGGSDLDTALLFTVGLDEASFITDFKANGGTFLANLQTSGMLSGPDVGGIHPGDASTVIPNGGTYSTNPLTGFAVTWEIGSSAQASNIRFQVGPNASDQLSVNLPEVTTFTLGIAGIDVTTRPQEAAQLLQSAVDILSGARNYLGSVGNRLEHAGNTDEQAYGAELRSYSQIVDLDYAHEIANMTRLQILQSSAAAMAAQANVVPRLVLSLLEGPPPEPLAPRRTAIGTTFT